MHEQKSNKGVMIAKAAEKLASKNVNSACWFWLYQPEVPNKVVEKLKKK